MDHVYLLVFTSQTVDLQCGIITFLCGTESEKMKQNKA